MSSYMEFDELINIVRRDPEKMKDCKTVTEVMVHSSLTKTVFHRGLRQLSMIVNVTVRMQHVGGRCADRSALISS